MTLIQFFKNKIVVLKDLLDQDPGKFEVKPDSVWFVMVVIFCILALCIAAFSFNIFTRISNPVLVESDSGILGTISREKLNGALDYLKTKEEKFNYLKNNRPKIIDPSR